MRVDRVDDQKTNVDPQIADDPPRILDGDLHRFTGIGTVKPVVVGELAFPPEVRADLEVPLDQPPLRGRQLAAAVIANINNNLPIAHLFCFERSNDSIPPRPP